MSTSTLRATGTAAASSVRREHLSVLYAETSGSGRKRDTRTEPLVVTHRTSCGLLTPPAAPPEKLGQHLVHWSPPAGIGGLSWRRSAASGLPRQRCEELVAQLVAALAELQRDDRRVGHEWCRQLVESMTPPISHRRSCAADSWLVRVTGVATTRALEGATLALAKEGTAPPASARPQRWAHRSMHDRLHHEITCHS